MDANGFMEAVGGRQRVMELTGLTRGRVSQWAVENHIPKSWVKFFAAQFPVESVRFGLVAKDADVAA